MSGLRFECTGCGNCCTFHGEAVALFLSDDEVGALARVFGLPVPDFRRLYTFKERGWTKVHTIDDHCAFYDRHMQACTVYQARPLQCRTYPFHVESVDAKTGEWTPEVRQVCEGVGQGPLYQIEEASEKMTAMLQRQVAIERGEQ